MTIQTDTPYFKESVRMEDVIWANVAGLVFMGCTMHKYSKGLTTNIITNTSNFFLRIPLFLLCQSINLVKQSQLIELITLIIGHTYFDQFFSCHPPLCV